MITNNLLEESLSKLGLTHELLLASNSALQVSFEETEAKFTEALSNAEFAAA